MTCHHSVIANLLSILIQVLLSRESYPSFFFITAFAWYFHTWSDMMQSLIIQIIHLNDSSWRSLRNDPLLYITKCTIKMFHSTNRSKAKFKISVNKSLKIVYVLTITSSNNKQVLESDDFNKLHM